MQFVSLQAHSSIATARFLLHLHFEGGYSASLAIDSLHDHTGRAFFLDYILRTVSKGRSFRGHIGLLV